jgi:hypothetical protein
VARSWTGRRMRGRRAAARRAADDAKRPAGHPSGDEPHPADSRAPPGATAGHRRSGAPRAGHRPVGQALVGGLQPSAAVLVPLARRGDPRRPGLPPRWPGRQSHLREVRASGLPPLRPGAGRGQPALPPCVNVYTRRARSRPWPGSTRRWKSATTRHG